MKKGYTLMEVLIVLVVLATIAVLVMPSILSSMPNKNKLLFRKSYSTLAQAVYEITNNRFLYPGDDASIPILRQPNLCNDARTLPANNAAAPAGACATKVRNILGVTADTAVTNVNFFCYAISSVLSSITNDCTTAGAQNLHVQTPDGVAFYGLNTGNAFSAANQTLTITIDVDPRAGRGQTVTTYSAGANDNEDVFQIQVKENGRLTINANATDERNYLEDITNYR